MTAFSTGRNRVWLQNGDLIDNAETKIQDNGWVHVRVIDLTTNKIAILLIPATNIRYIEVK